MLLTGSPIQTSPSCQCPVSLNFILPVKTHGSFHIPSYLGNSKDSNQIKAIHNEIYIIYKSTWRLLHFIVHAKRNILIHRVC